MAVDGGGFFREQMGGGAGAGFAGVGGPRGGEGVGSGDVDDAAVAVVDEVAGGERAAGDVVHGDRAGVGVGGAVDHHQGYAALDEQGQAVAVGVDGCDEHAADPLLGEQVEVA